MGRRSRAPLLAALTGARSTSETIDIALNRLVRAERLLRDILAYQQMLPTTEERALAGQADFAALAEDETDWATKLRHR